jgi:hypothetical protein
MSDTNSQTPLSFKDWKELDAAVTAKGGVLRVWMKDLREVAGKARLKALVLVDIQKQLANHGIGHLPATLPGDQSAYAVLYKTGDPAGAVIAAVRSGDSTTNAEEALRRLNQSEPLEADLVKDAKLAELSEKVDELDMLVKGFREVLAE